MIDDLRETVIRQVILRDNLKPVQIYQADTYLPIDPDWLAITHAQSEADNIDSYNLVFLTFAGVCITWFQFETLEIALDQADDIVGVHASEWTTCHREITNEDGTIPWSMEE